MLLQMTLFHSFFWLSNIPWYIHHIFFIHSSVGGHFGCFPVLAIVNSAVTLGYTYLFELEFSSFLGICPGVGLLNHMVTLFLVFLRKLHTAPIYCSNSMRVPFFSTPSPTFIILATLF